MKIRNTNEAYYYFKDIIKNRGGEVVAHIPSGYHRIIKVKFKDRYFYFYLIFQREWFHNFRNIYNVNSDACTIDLDILEAINKMGFIDRLVFINKDGDAYMVNPYQMYREAKMRGWIRKQRNGTVVVHYPVTKMLKLLTPKYKEITEYA